MIPYLHLKGKGDNFTPPQDNLISNIINTIIKEEMVMNYPICYLNKQD